MIIGILRLIRLYYTVPFSCGLAVIAAYIVGGDFTLLDKDFLLAVLSLFLVLSAGYAFNDACDVRADTINNPDRPIPKGQVGRKTALVLSIVLLVSGLATAIFTGRQFFAVLSLISMGLAVYDIISKKMGIFKDLLAAILMTSLYPLTFTVAEPVETARLKAVYVFPVWLFLTAFGYEMLKDVRDVRGDSIAENTVHCSICATPAFLLSARAILLTAVLLAVLPYVLGYCGFIYLASALLSIVLVVFALRKPPAGAIPFIYTEVFLITAGSMADLMVYGP